MESRRPRQYTEEQKRELRRRRAKKRRILQLRRRIRFFCITLFLFIAFIIIFSIFGKDKDSKNLSAINGEASIENNIDIQQGNGEYENIDNENTNNENTDNETMKEEDTVKGSLLDFLKIAIQPVGQTMYVWGGGWNPDDTSAGVEAVTLGVSSRWAEFAAAQTSTYDYDDTRYQIHDGLDCSGYVGWAIYNILETENGKDGYVFASTKMALEYSKMGLGEYISKDDITEWMPGDIMSMYGHVWICVGMCEDGSVLFLHSSPPGVIFSGTLASDESATQASILAEYIMSTYYPDWYSRFPECARSYSYLTDSSAMRWSRDVLSDEEGLCDMTANQIVKQLFN